MRAVLNRIFKEKLGIGKFVVSGLAFFTGFTLVLLSLQGYVKIRAYLEPKNTASNYIILNKEVEMAHTLLGGKAHFSQAEIENLKQQSFAGDVGVFKSNNFLARAYIGGNLGFSTELFFESVPTRFIDNVTYKFKWEEGDEFIPLIISQDFLNLYNFGYAIGRGTPQLSKSTIQLVPLKIEISGRQGRSVYDAKVVGFSDRITSVLVPDEFLTWANKHIGSSDGGDVSRVIIKVRNEQSAALENYMKEHRLKVSDEKLSFGKVMTAINVVLSILVFIGTAFMIFALVIVIMNFSLMVAEARDEVSLLLQLGYKGSYLVTHLVRYLMIFMGIVTIVSLSLFYIGNYLFMNFLAENGMDIGGSISWQVMVLGMSTLLVSTAISYYSIRRLIKKSV